jgi:uncharacterized protein (DUF4415 family)
VFTEPGTKPVQKGTDLQKGTTNNPQPNSIKENPFCYNDTGGKAMSRPATKEPRFPDKRILSLLVSKDLLERFRAKCKEEGKSMNGILSPKVERLLSILLAPKGDPE